MSYLDADNPYHDNLQYWKPEEYAGVPEPVMLARAILQRWFEAMENGTAIYHKPNPLYPVHFTTEQVNEVIRKLDLSFDYERWLFGYYQAGPDFHRLAPEQRLALVQELHAVLKDYKHGHTSWPHLNVSPQVNYGDDWG